MSKGIFLRKTREKKFISLRLNSVGGGTASDYFLSELHEESQLPIGLDDFGWAIDSYVKRELRIVRLFLPEEFLYGGKE